MKDTTEKICINCENWSSGPEVCNITNAHMFGTDFCSKFVVTDRIKHGPGMYYVLKRIEKLESSVAMLDSQISFIYKMVTRGELGTK